MDMLVIGIRVLETMFFLGVVGSIVVLVLTTIADIETLTESDDPAHT
jgi:hypothetical protein